MKRILISVLTIAGIVLPAGALVNPSLQPIHLYERYNVALVGKVIEAELTNEV